MSRPTPEELDEIRSRDRGACERLVLEHYQKVYSLHFRLTGNTEDAADLTQETFRTVWEKIDSFRGESDFSTWLYRLAYNTNIDFHRKHQRTCVAHHRLESVIETEDKSMNVSVATRLMDADEHQHISRQIDRLDGCEQEVIVLHYLQQLTIQQTAEVLGIAVGTVKWRLNQALSELRRFLNVDATS